MKLLRVFILLSVFLILMSCGSNNQKQENTAIKTPVLLVEGNWHLELNISENNSIPVDFTLTKIDTNYVVTFINAEEQIVSNVTVDNSTIIIKDAIFNTWFEGKIESPNKIRGFWYKEDEKYKIPFIAQHGITDRFTSPESLSLSQPNISGKWEVDFSKGTDDHYKAIGVFQQVDNYVTGTFITETGDYRFLEGNMYNNNLYLSTFDGSHAFLFKATFINGHLEGNFWSGTHWEEPWVAVKNDNFELSNPDSLTILKEGYDELNFNFPSLSGDSISLNDEKYNNKVVIVNIMGPWCPNCKDETAYLTELYSRYHEKGLEIVALSFTKTDDFAKSKESTQKVKDFYRADYDFLIAGKANKIEASKALPMLNNIISYPTSIFIDKMGKVRKIRTGFYGPGTGNYYTRYTEETDNFVAKLLAEKIK